MGDRFDRVASSSYGEASHGTEADRLLSTRIEVDSFLMGLLLQRPGRSDGLGAWRFARSVREARRTSTVVPLLKSLAESPTSDPLSRFSATVAWTFLQFEEKQGRKAREADEAALAKASKVSLHPVARAWVAKEQRPE